MNPPKQADKKPQSKGSLTKQSQDKNQAQKEARDQILHMNFNLDIPEKLSERGDLDSCLGQTDREVEAELIKHVDEAKAQYKKRQAEFNKNYNKANTVSLTTKYQMMFVKIEVYLMNFYHIYQNYNYPLVKTAFYKIKLAAKAQKASTALASLTILGKIKRALLGLNHIERKKTTASLMMAFSKIKDRNESPALIEQMKAVKSAKIKKMKELLLEKKDEIEYLTSQLEDLNGRTKSRGEIASASKTKDTDLKVFEKKKLQNKLFKEEERHKKLKASLRATEDKVLGFIGDINSMLDSHEDFFASNEQFNQIWNDFLTNKNFLN